MARNLTQIQDDACIPPELIALTHRAVTPEEFEQLCAEYDDLRLELTSTGELIVMPGTDPRTGRRNSNLTRQLDIWTENDGSGLCFDSSTIFALPNNARRSPDASWISRERWDRLSESQKDSFAPICPDFVVELRSKSDRLPPLLNKMSEYIENGASLAWLIDPSKRKVYVYRPNQPLIILNSPDIVSAEPELRGFELSLNRIWSTE
jgi:Uma2 family endonuclease